MCESFSFYSLQKTSQNPSLKMIIFLHFLNFMSNTTLQIGFWLLHKESPNDWWDLSPLKKDQSICDAPKLCFINHMKVYQAWNSTWNLIFKKPISIFFSSKSICIWPNICHSCLLLWNQIFILFRKTNKSPNEFALNGIHVMKL